MDFIVKFTIGLFIFSLLLLFFKSTKKLTNGYMDGYINKYQDFHEIMNKEEMEKEEETDNDQRCQCRHKEVHVHSLLRSP